MYANKKIAPGALTPRATKTLLLFYFIMAGVEGLEPPAPGFGDLCLYSDKLIISIV